MLVSERKKHILPKRSHSTCVTLVNTGWNVCEARLDRIFRTWKSPCSGCIVLFIFFFVGVPFSSKHKCSNCIKLYAIPAIPTNLLHYQRGQAPTNHWLNWLDHVMVNWWFGSVVWIFGIPSWKELLLRSTLIRIPNHQAPKPLNH